MIKAFLAAIEVVEEHISSIGTLIGAIIVSIVVQIVNGVATWVKRLQTEHALAKIHSKVEEINKDQVETKHELNSRLTELLAIAKAAAHAEGRLEGIEEQKRRVATGDTGEPCDTSR